jgi:hypothetical protein
LVHQPEVGFMDQGRGLERVVGALLPQIIGGAPS